MALFHEMRQDGKNCLELVNLCAGYDSSAPVLRNVSLRFHTDGITVFLGRNGCGKSTLLRTMAGLLRPLSGDALWNGRSVFSMTAGERARHFGFLSQRDEIPDDMTAEELLFAGRFPYRKWHGVLSEPDYAAVEEAVRLTELGPLRRRQMGTMSGGERQKTRIAALFAQSPEMIFLDEPTAFLDPGEQQRMMNMICRWNREKHVPVIQVLHDVNLAARCADRAAAFGNYCLIYDGRAAEFLTREMMSRVLNCEEGICFDAPDGLPAYLPERDCRG